MPKFYLTTAIDYVNSKPHLGTAYEKIAADVVARYKRLKGYDTYFLMGNDEHSQNVAARAKELNLDVMDYCDQMEEEFRRTWKMLHISFDDFIRTTNPRHISTVNELLQKIQRKGDIYKGKYRGWYCISCEAFYQSKDLTDGKCPSHGTIPSWITEENYFFSLSKYREQLLHHIEEHPEFVLPEVRRNEIVSMLKSGLEDISISRSGTPWGIPLPFDEESVVYVWFDALINYLSGVGFSDDSKRYRRYWPADLHIIGKDITRFHCIIWPAMLLSADIPLPKSIFGHGFVKLRGEKMSKTTGTILDPLRLAESYGADPLRYFLISEIPFDRDGDFSLERFKERFNSDLANDYGNLVSRSLTMVDKYQKGRVVLPTKASDDTYLQDIAEGLLARYEQAMESYQLHQGVRVAWELIRGANLYIDSQKPWLLAKDTTKGERLAEVLFNLIEAIRQVTILLKPIMPVKTREVWQQLGLASDFEKVTFKELEEWGKIPSDTMVKSGQALFPRIEERE
ncbi:MAG: methionine--tRNA ligase, partial [Acidobacteriota bacterium]